MDLNMKVLIVDDFATMRRILKNIMKQIGFSDITEADNGKNALKVLKSQAIDLVLCDWNMPEMPGIEVLNTVRADDELKATPFIMVTAEAQKENILEAVKSGVSSYIVNRSPLIPWKRNCKRYFPVELQFVSCRNDMVSEKTGAAGKDDSQDLNILFF